MIDTPAALGPALFRAVLKSSQADFVVDEQLDITADGQGEHWLLHLRKSGLNTQQIVSALQEACSVREVDIGYCGLKDRQAVTRQWFTLRTALPIESVRQALQSFEQEAPEEASVELLAYHRHGRKLRHGAHRGNHFVITLRSIQAQDGLTTETMKQVVDQRIARIRQAGFPNYIGPQRFGMGGQNLQRARQWFRQPKRRTSRQQRSLWLSAARSDVFNRVCAARVSAGSWQTLLPGEPAILAGSRSYFDTQTVSQDELTTRLQSFDIHPSAPWWGRGASAASQDCAAFESQVLASCSELCDGLERAGLSQERRALRAVANDLSHEWLDDSTLRLSFHLSPGVFATTLLRELGDCLQAR